MEKLFKHSACFSRVLIAPFYIGLGIFMLVLLCQFGVQLWHAISQMGSATLVDTMHAGLGLLKLALIARLFIYVIKLGSNMICDAPEMCTGQMMRPKMLGILIAIASVHLLETYLDIGSHTVDEIQWTGILYGLLVLGALIFAGAHYVLGKAK